MFSGDKSGLRVPLTKSNTMPKLGAHALDVLGHLPYRHVSALSAAAWTDNLDDRQTLIDMAKHLGWNWTRSTRKTQGLDEMVYQMTLVEDGLQEYANKMESMQDKVH